MKIIIVGGGKAGATLVRSLTDEGHDVTIIDYDPQKVTAICNNNDVLGIVGNGMNYSALADAGLADADILISVTGSDEQNLLCCLFAKKAGKCSTIARIRNPHLPHRNQFYQGTGGAFHGHQPRACSSHRNRAAAAFPLCH